MSTGCPGPVSLLRRGSAHACRQPERPPAPRPLRMVRGRPRAPPRARRARSRRGVGRQPTEVGAVGVGDQGVEPGVEGPALASPAELRAPRGGPSRARRGALCQAGASQSPGSLSPPPEDRSTKRACDEARCSVSRRGECMPRVSTKNAPVYVALERFHAVIRGLGLRAEAVALVRPRRAGRVATPRSPTSRARASTTPGLWATSSSASSWPEPRC